ncbi:MAG: DHH family phosphoesterase [Spirochaetaceae bacterium]
MQRQPVPEELLQFLRDFDHFHVLGHIEPDGDCIGSQIALALFLNRSGKKAHLVNPGPFERAEVRHFASRFASELPRRTSEQEAVIILDSSTLDRIGDLAAQLDGRPVAVIDHHASGEHFGDIRFVDPSIPATTLMVQAVIESFEETPAPDEASMLFFGLATDTGFFRFLDQNGGDVFHAAGRLTDAGASPRESSALISGGRTFASRKLIGRLLERATSHAGGRFILTYMTAAERREFGKENRDSDTLYQLLLSIEECEVIAFVREESETVCKGSLRATSEIDVGEIATHLGGGGHQKAAGFLNRGSLQETTAKVVRLVTERLESQNGYPPSSASASQL